MLQIDNEIRPELAAAHSRIFRENWGHFHHLDATRELMRKNPEVLLESMERNIDLFTRSLHPTDAERKIIRVVSADMSDGPYKSAYAILEMISGYEKVFETVAAGLVDPGSSFYRIATKDLAERMTEAWEPFIDHEDIKDNHSDAKKREKYDHMIYGHVNGALTPDIDVEFGVLHDIARITEAWFRGTQFEELTSHKDWIFEIMGARMFLDNIEDHDVWFNHFFNLWRCKRPKGLGWLNNKRMDAYQRAAAS